MEQEVQVILTLSIPTFMDKEDIERHILEYLKDSVEVIKIEVKEESEIYRNN
jgi:hypothetical protein